MSRHRNRPIETATNIFFRLPMAAKIVVAAVVLAVVFIAVNTTRTPKAPAIPLPPGSIVLMFWNVENLFDDRDDDRNSIDNPYDDWFAEDADAHTLKYEHLAEIIVGLNDGTGPDVFAGVEVESLRAAELLRDAMNARLPAGAARYEFVAMKELSHNAGRFMAPCVISRIPLDADRTRLLGSHNLRILETHLADSEADLCLVVSHWTSQRSDDGSRKGHGRDRYATTIYEEYEQVMQGNPDADFLVCGDFNTPPDSPAVTRELHMTDRRDEVVPSKTDPRLFGLLSGKPPERFGTLYYKKPLIYDQIGVSPGMFDDKGWSCDANSVRVPIDGMIRNRSRARRPWRFGNKNDDPQGRGFSDHFPVVVNLSVNAREIRSTQ